MSSAMCCPQTFCTEEVGGGGFFFYFLFFYYYKGGEFISFPSLIRQRWTQRASCFTCMVFTEENKKLEKAVSPWLRRQASRERHVFALLRPPSFPQCLGRGWLTWGAGALACFQSTTICRLRS